MWQLCRLVCMWDSRQWEQSCPQCFDWLLGIYFSCWIVVYSLNMGGRGAWFCGSLIPMLCWNPWETSPFLYDYEEGRLGEAEGRRGERMGERREGKLWLECKINKLINKTWFMFFYIIYFGKNPSAAEENLCILQCSDGVYSSCLRSILFMM